MSSTWIIEAIDIFEDGHLSVATRPPGLLPKQLSLDGFEEGFDSRVVAAIPSSVLSEEFELVSARTGFLPLNQHKVDATRPERRRGSV